jgi:hypothetical protein
MGTADPELVLLWRSLKAFVESLILADKSIWALAWAPPSK